MMDWQPIETAPRDGTIVLLANRGNVYAGWWDSKDRYKWKFIDDTAEVITGCCDKERDGRVEPNGWTDSKYGPTNWMPLPNPPNT